MQINLIKRRFLDIFLLISLAGFLVWPQFALAQEDSLLLPGNEAKKILKITKTPLTEIVINSFGSPPLFESVAPREAGGAVTLRQAIVKGEFRYWFKEFPKEFSIKFIKVILQVAILVKAPNASALFNKLEKISVKKANEYLTERLLADVTRTAIGEVNYSYSSYKGTHQEVAFQYVMNYYPRDSKHGKIAVIFYSSKSFEPPKSQGSVGSAGRPSIWKDITPWPLSDWQNNEKKRDNDGKIEPFIVEITGDVIRDAPSVLGFGPVIYSWDKSKEGPIAKVDFSKPVPELEFSELSWLEKQRKKIENTIKEKMIVLMKLSEKAGEVSGNAGNFFGDVAETIKKAVGDVFAKIKSVISQIRHLGAGLVELPEFEIPEELLPEPEFSQETSPPEAEEAEEIPSDGFGGGEFSETEPEPEPQPESKLTLAEIQEGLDDIAEEIDILGQEVDQLVAVSRSISEEVSEEASEVPEIEEPEEIIEEPEEIVEEEESEEEPEKGQDEAGQEVGQEFCEKIPGEWPSKNRLIINEVAWMGTNNSTQDEWIELKNISGSEIDLSGWQLLDKDNRIKIIFSGDRTSANSFYLLERTNDDSVPGITADLIYTGVLNNTSEALYLFNPDCQLEDEVLANPDWPAGDRGSKRTMERKSNLEWQTSSDIGGTPKSENSAGYYEDSGGGGSGEANGGGVDGGIGGTPPLAEPTFCSQDNLFEPTYSPIIINEIAWMGSASSSADEWIELKNTSTTIISLESWQILDKDENIKIVFGDIDSIPINGFYLLERTDDNSVPNISADKIYTGNLKNNDESLRLFDQNCELVDEVIANVGDDLKWPAGDKDERRTMEKNPDLTWHTYFGDGENGIMGTPRAENSQSPLLLPLPILEVSTVALSFEAEEEGSNPVRQFLFIKNIGEEDLNWTIFIAYTITSPTSTNNWLSISSTAGTIPARASSTVEISVDVSNLEQRDYNATATVEAIGAQDSPQKISVSLTILPKPKLAQNVVITEVQIADKEFVELYNPLDYSVSTTGWYLSYFPATLDEEGNPKYDWHNPYLNKEFPAASIMATSTYYLIAFGEYPEVNGNPDPDWKPYSAPLSNSAGAIGIFSSNPKEATTSEGAREWKIDVFSWKKENIASSPVFEEVPFLFDEEEIIGKSFQRKQNPAGFYINNKDNSKDFEIQALSPINSKGETGDILPPEPVGNFYIATSTNNSVSLTWSIATDPDTFQENIYYIIYYSRQEEITGANLDATTTLIATTTVLTLAISDLYYNSTYYFGIKAFDGRHYSSLSTLPISYQISSVWENSLWPTYRYNPQHTGRSSFLGLETEKSIIKKIFQGNIVDPNNIFYSKATIAGRAGILASYLDGSQKWFYQADGVSSPALGQDGTVYTFASEKIIAISPAGKLKWKMTFPGYHTQQFSAGPLVGNDNNLYFTFNLRLSNGYLEPSLIALKDCCEEGKIIWIYAIKKEKLYHNLDELLKESAQPDNPEPIYVPVIDRQGNIYVGYGNAIFVFDSQGAKIGNRVFPHHCGAWYASCDPFISNLSIDENNKILYVIVKKEADFKTFLDVGHSHCLHSLDLENLETQNWGICMPGLSSLLPISAEGDVYFQRSWTPPNYAGRVELFSYNEQGIKNWNLLDFSSGLLLDEEGNIYFLSGDRIKIFNKDKQQIWP